MDGQVDGWMRGCRNKQGVIHPLHKAVWPHRLWGEPCDRDKLSRWAHRLAQFSRSFLARGSSMKLARGFLLHPSGDLRIWLRFSYFVLFFFLLLTPQLLFFLSLSARADASWPTAPLTLFSPPSVVLPALHIAQLRCEPHGSSPCGVYAAALPLTLLPLPGFFSGIKSLQTRAGLQHRPGWEPSCSRDNDEHVTNREAGTHGTQGSPLGRNKPESQPGLQTLTPALTPPHEKSFQ